MMRANRRGSALALAGVLMLTTAVAADDKGKGPLNGRAALDGYQEVPTLSTTGNGTLRLAISPDQTTVRYTLSYGSLEGNVTQAHIHLGRPAVNGGIIVFLCTNLAPPSGVPAPPACPTPSGTVSGTLTAADVLGPGGQGIGAGGFNRFLAALRSGATYANVHTSLYPPGEIRGAVSLHRHGADKR